MDMILNGEILDMVNAFAGHLGAKAVASRFNLSIIEATEALLDLAKKHLIIRKGNPKAPIFCSKAVRTEFTRKYAQKKAVAEGREYIPRTERGEYLAKGEYAKNETPVKKVERTGFLECKDFFEKAKLQPATVVCPSVTGRQSATKLNVQVLPKHVKERLADFHFKSVPLPPETTPPETTD